MRKRGAILCLLLSALLCGCSTPALPQTPATYDQVVHTQPTAVTIPAATEPITTVTPTEPIVSTIPSGTEPSTEPATTPTTVPSPGITACAHQYQQGLYQEPTCEQAGFQNLRCVKCGDVRQQLSLPLGHNFGEAGCTTPKICTRCAMTEGSALGHQYENGLCCRCGEKDPALRVISVQIKDSQNNPVDGVAVELRIEDTLYGTAISAAGQVSFTLTGHSGSYTLVLTGIPEGYKTQKDRYTFQSDTGAIVLEPIPVIYPDDHSRANYKVGSAVGTFTLTDMDGKTHSLSQLLQEKKVVILTFWYYSCGPCRAEFPYFNSIYQKYSDDIEILGLNHFDSEDQIRQLRSETGLSFPLAAEQLGMQQGFHIQSYPFTVFIGQNGKILYIQKDTGFQSEQELDTLVKHMISIWS